MDNTLIRRAIEVRERAYAPYSNFKVGAALLGKSGKIYAGCNVENAAYGPSNCAERTAFFTAIAQGEREFQAIAIVGGKEAIEEYVTPCGVCRQVMMEFCNPQNFFIIIAKSETDYKKYTLEQLFPKGFGSCYIK